MTGLGATIRRYREGLNMTQEDLAKAAGISRPYLVHIESGHRRNPSAKNLLRIAAALHVDQNVLFEAANYQGRRAVEIPTHPFALQAQRALEVLPPDLLDLLNVAIGSILDYYEEKRQPKMSDPRQYKEAS